MANNFDSGIEKQISNSFLKGFESQRVLTKTINTQLSRPGFNVRSGDTVYVPRPYRTTAVETTDGNITGLTSDITAGQAPIKVQGVITTFAEWNTVDQAIRIGNLDAVMKPMATELLTKLESRVGQQMIRNSGLLSGTPGTAITKWSDVAAFNTMLEQIGVPMDDNRYAAVSPSTRENLANVQSGLANGDDSLVNQAWRDAMISKDFGGLKAFSSNALPTYQSGTSAARTGTVTATPTATYVAHKDTMIQTVTLSGLTASAANAIRPGDQIRITTANRSRINLNTKEIIFDQAGAQVPWTWTVVTGGNATAGGQVTITVTAPAIHELNGSVPGAYNNIFTPIVAGDAFQLLGSANVVYQPALFYHRDAFTMATIPLPKLYSKDTVMTSEDGISIRMTRYSDGDANSNKVRFDILWAFGVLEPLFAGVGFGK